METNKKKVPKAHTHDAQDARALLNYPRTHPKSWEGMELKLAPQAWWGDFVVAKVCMNPELPCISFRERCDMKSVSFTHGDK